MGAAALAMLPVPAERPFPEGWVIIKEGMDDTLYGEIGKQMAKALARSMMQTKEIVARNVLGRVFPDDYTYKTYDTAMVSRS